MAKVERTVHFYLADSGADEGGHPLQFDPMPALKVIDSLPFRAAPNGRYEQENEGNVLCLFAVKRRWDRVQFCRVRRSELPLVEQAGKLSELRIPANAGLSEAIHVRFFPHNIVGAMYNHFGPRVSSLGQHLHVISGRAIPPVEFRPLLNSDTTRLMDNLDDLRLLEFDIRRSYKNVVADADGSLAAAFDSNEELLGSQETISLVAKPERRAAQQLIARLRSPLRSIMQRRDLHENVARLRARGKRTDTGRVETIDFLRDRFASNQEVVRMGGRNRSLNSKSAFDAISRAYVQLKDELELAASVSP